MAETDTVTAPMMRLLSIQDADIEAQLDRLYLENHKDHIFQAGIRYFLHFVDKIFEAQEGANINDIRKAVQAAREGGVPEGLIKTALDSARAGEEDLPGFDTLDRVFDSGVGAYENIFLRTEDDFFEAALTRENHNARRIWDKMTHYQWQGCRFTVLTDQTPLPPQDVFTINLSDYISFDGRIYFEMLGRAVSEGRGEALFLTGLTESLLKLNRKIATPEGVNLAMALVALVQGYALLREDEAGVDIQALKNIAGRILNKPGIRRPPERQKLLLSKLEDRGLAVEIERIWREIDLAYVKGRAGGLRVYVTRDSYRPLSLIEYLDDQDHCDVTPYPALMVYERLREWGYNPPQIEEITAAILENGSLNNAPFLSSEQRELLSQAEFSNKDEISMIAALQSSMLGMLAVTIPMPPQTSVDDMRKTTIQAWGLGVKWIDLYRERSGWDEPLLSCDILPENDDRDEIPVAEKRVFA